jgi:hypothetical protein
VQTAPAAVLTEEQRGAYEQQGWLAVPGLVDGASLDRLRAVTAGCPRQCLVPPSGPYRPIFASQQRET